MPEKQLFPVRREFIATDQNGAGDGLFYFHEPGDFLKGILFGTMVRETLHYKFRTYRMKLFEGRQDGVDLLVTEDQIIEFPANQKMRRIIEDHELIGSLVRIVFKGKRGRYKKYEVYKDTGLLFKNEEQKNERSRSRTRRKSRAKVKRAGATATA